MRVVIVFICLICSASQSFANQYGNWIMANNDVYMSEILKHTGCYPGVIYEICNSLEEKSKIQGWSHNMYYHIAYDVHSLLGCVEPAVNVVAAGMIYKLTYKKYITAIKRFKRIKRQFAIDRVVGIVVNASHIPDHRSLRSLEDTTGMHYDIISCDKGIEFPYNDIMDEQPINDVLEMIGVNASTDKYNNIFELSGANVVVQAALAHYLSNKHCDAEDRVKDVCSEIDDR